MTMTFTGPLPTVLCQTIFPPDAASLCRPMNVGLLLVGGREDLSAGRYSVDCGCNPDIGYELHHNFDEFLPRNAAPQGSADMGSQLRRRGPERRQSGDGDDLPRA